jgi:hypothetical protein
VGQRLRTVDFHILVAFSTTQMTFSAQGTLFQGTVRVNSKNTNQVFIDVPSFNHNAIVASAAATNRAMDGDIVAGTVCILMNTL